MVQKRHAYEYCTSLPASACQPFVLTYAHCAPAYHQLRFFFGTLSVGGRYLTGLLIVVPFVNLVSGSRVFLEARSQSDGLKPSPPHNFFPTYTHTEENSAPPLLPPACTRPYTNHNARRGTKKHSTWQGARCVALVFVPLRSSNMGKHKVIPWASMPEKRYAVHPPHPPPPQKGGTAPPGWPMYSLYVFLAQVPNVYRRCSAIQGGTHLLTGDCAHVLLAIRTRQSAACRYLLVWPRWPSSGQSRRQPRPTQNS